MIWTPEKDAELIALRAEGLSNGQIARRMGVSRNSICGRRRRLRELAERPEGWRPSKPRIYVAPSIPISQKDRPCKAPFEPDETVPDFAWDDEHCAAVMAQGGFPVAARRIA